MSLYISVNRQQALTVTKQLQLLALPRNKQVRLLKTLGRQQKKAARARIRQQRGTDGQPFSPRKSKKKGKMLRHLAKSLEPYVTAGDTLTLRHKNRLTGGIAALQQQGGHETMTAKRMEKIHGRPDYQASCTKKQAKALLKAGYRVKRKKGKGLRRPSINELMDTLRLGQAGLILRQLRQQQSSRSWQIPVPARPFLGDTSANVQSQLVDILETMRK